MQRRFPYQGKCRRRRQKGNLAVCKADGGIVIKSSGRASHNLPTSGRRIPFLRCPKYSSAYRLEYFDRGAKDCSLHRPQDALRSLCSTWNKTQKAAFRRPFVFFQGNVSLAKLHGFFLYNCRRGCEAHRSSAKIIRRSFRFFEMPLPSAQQQCKCYFPRFRKLCSPRRAPRNSSLSPRAQRCL